MRARLFIVTTALATLAAMGAAEARPAHGGPSHGSPLHGGHPSPRTGRTWPHHASPPHRRPPPPQGWAKVGKHIYTTATWRGGQRGAWSTDVPF